MAMMTPAGESLSTRPYLVRAIYEWCSDNNFTPYVAVQVDETVQVPREFVRNNEIVLNISMEATSSLQLGNEYIQFKARFGGVSREIMVPLNRVLAIYALENGQGMAFPVAPATSSAGPALTAALSRVSGPASHGAPTDALPSAPSVGQAEHPSLATGAKILQLVPQAHAQEQPQDGIHTIAPGAQEPQTDPPEPPPSNPTRPTLTRVK
jgi:stringent starvation protein B